MFLPSTLMNQWSRRCLEIARVGWPYSSSAMGRFQVEALDGWEVSCPKSLGTSAMKKLEIPSATLLTSIQGHRFICPQNPHVASGFEQAASGQVDTIRRRFGCLSSSALTSGHADIIGQRRLGCLSSSALSSRKQPQKPPNPQIGLHPITGCRRKDMGHGRQRAALNEHSQERLRSVMVDIWASAAAKASSEAGILMEGPLSGLSCRWREVRASPLGNIWPQSP
ncbi:predicted protein [Chaetomium globosum CBS 148.51]|uniref:Uncharacterized protein n=1 Tax=Chaetomium globosum (strain ATCC 6205 / CBS 148.51 / DSM 1962 / NBRC 6347 / NRRL 1970) TaxID=306901 RepID=Q2GNA3_CHAGB|nr:uncharacterized protein CHGG_10551 [Chaetomium globosum CBS 148.51]EAQ84147.1 predicted protein [Chaetomium globosum CBS 148.51]